MPSGKLLIAALAVCQIFGAGAVWANDGQCLDLADRLESCEAYSCIFIHPHSGLPTERRIIGLRDGLCKIEEELPNNGLLACAYPMAMRLAVANYYRDIQQGTAPGHGPEQVRRTPTRYVVNDKVVENPLQEAYDSGVCLVTGY